MKFIELSGATLRKVINAGELNDGDLHESGVQDDSILRINEHGDIELRRYDRWDVIGGLIGDYEDRVKTATGLNWT